MLTTRLRAFLRSTCHTTGADQARRTMQPGLVKPLAAAVFLLTAALAQPAPPATHA